MSNSRAGRKPKGTPPSMRRGVNGSARVTLKGVDNLYHDHYCGRWGSPEARNRYAELLAKYWTATPRASTEPHTKMSVAELILEYVIHAESYYRKAGRKTSEIAVVKAALGFLRRCAGDDLLTAVGPRRLQAVRDAMPSMGWSRNTANHYLSVIRAMFRWAVSREYYSPTALVALQTVPGFAAGRTTAAGQAPRETAEIEPVDYKVVEATKAYLSPMVRDMVDLQLATAMRPGEVTMLTWAEIDQSSDIWLYRPSKHKTAHHNRQREIPLGPQAQAILARYKTTSPAQVMFSMTVSGLRQAIQRGADAANEVAIADAKRQGVTVAGRLVPRWFSNQLRHTKLTEIRAQFGLECAQTVAGHSSADMTEIYAKAALAKAIDVARQVG